MRKMVVNKRTDEYDVYIGRGSVWGNPFVIGTDGTRAQVIAKYARYLRAQPALLERLGELDGKVLGCFCAPKACHGDVLRAELAKRAVAQPAPEPVYADEPAWREASVYSGLHPEDVEREWCTDHPHCLRLAGHDEDDMLSALTASERFEIAVEREQDELFSAAFDY